MLVAANASLVSGLVFDYLGFAIAVLTIVQMILGLFVKE